MDNSFKTWREGKILFLALTILFCSLTYVAWQSLMVMVQMWNAKEEYGYAYIIPAITAFFLWQRRYIVLGEKFELSWAGFLFAVFGVIVLLVGVLSATNSIIQYGFLVVLIASIWMLIGWHAFRKILGPLLLLFLVIPLPAFLFNNLSAYLQLISSEIGVWVIRLFGVSVYLEGNVIDLGTFKLQVIDACSGLRYLFPLFSLAFIAAFIFKAAMWKRVILVLSSIPITVFMNSFRIGVIGVLVEYFGIAQAKGFLHEFEGWIIFMACTGLLVLEMWILLKIGHKKTKFSEAFSIDEVIIPDEPYKNNHGAISTKHIVAGVFISLLSLSIAQVGNRQASVPTRDSFVSFPLELGEWHGQSDSIEPDVLGALKLSDYFIANYIKQPGGYPVNLYMAYYDKQKAGEAAHSPRSCIPGGGWQIKDSKTVNIKGITMAGHLLSVNRLVIEKGEYGQLVYYWFQQRGRVITNEYMVKWYLFWDALTEGRTDGALVRLTTPIKRGDNIKLADERLRTILKKIQPLMNHYIPE